MCQQASLLQESQVAAPVAGKPATYRGQHDMAAWWAWIVEVEAASLPSYRPFIQRGDLVFDIGANRGTKTDIFRRLGAWVVAVDPLLAFGAEFVPEFWWRHGGDGDVLAIGRAVTTDPEVTISINQFMPWCSSIDRRWMTESKHAPKYGETYYVPTSLVYRQVQGVTLDALIAIYGLPAFVKVDVEGAEDSAIATLSIPVRGINMEFHQDWIPIAAIEHMDALGHYEWNYCLDNRGEFVMPEWECRGKLFDYMRGHLTLSGDGSWGDIYGRLA